LAINTFETIPIPAISLPSPSHWGLQKALTVPTAITMRAKVTSKSLQPNLKHRALDCF